MGYNQRASFIVKVNNKLEEESRRQSSKTPPSLLATFRAGMLSTRQMYPVVPGPPGDAGLEDMEKGSASAAAPAAEGDTGFGPSALGGALVTNLKTAAQKIHKRASFAGGLVLQGGGDHAEASSTSTTTGDDGAPPTRTAANGDTPPPTPVAKAKEHRAGKAAVDKYAYWKKVQQDLKPLMSWMSMHHCFHKLFSLTMLWFACIMLLAGNRLGFTIDAWDYLWIALGLSSFSYAQYYLSA
eukprot:4296884-Prymnesium_polylepis.1